MDGARERREGSKPRREGATERGRGAREERRRNGDREGGKLQGRYPAGADTGRYTVYSIQRTKTHNAALAIATLVLQIKNCKRVYKPCIVMRRNVLFDRWMK